MTEEIKRERPLINIVKLYNRLLQGYAVRPTQWAEHTGQTRVNVYAQINSLKAAGVNVIQPKRGVYSLITNPKED